MRDWRAEQHDHNRRFCENLDTQGYPDWAITGRFYAAVVLVDGVLARERGSAPIGHEERARSILAHSSTRPIWPDYDALKSMSERARYRTPHSRWTSDDVREADALLEAIRAQIGARL